MLKARVMLRWSARVASVVVVTLFVLFAWGEDFSRASAREWVGLIFFPLGVAAGLALAWWREALGAAFAASSLSAFYLAYGLLLSGRIPGGPWFIIFTSPAALFFASWVCGRWRHDGGGVAVTRA